MGMTMTKQAYQQYILETVTTSSKEVSWLSTLRSTAQTEFNDVKFPTNRHESWKYFNLKGLLDQSIAPLSSTSEPLSQSTVHIHDGHVVNLSKPLPQGVHTGSLSDISDELGVLLTTGVASTPFSYLNTLKFEDIAWIHIEKGTVLSEPLTVTLSHSSHDATRCSHPRILIFLEEGSEATIAMDDVHTKESSVFMNSMVDIVLQKNAKLEFTQLKQGLQAYCFCALHLQLHESSYFNGVHFVQNGEVNRSDTCVDFHGEDVECYLNGLALIKENYEWYNHLLINHFVGNNVCRQFFKTILTDQAKSEFSGLVYVHKKSHGTDSSQLNQNLLLSDQARALSRPQLQIDADDVLCNHGSTIGQLNPEEVFYIMSRGLSEKEAKALLTYGFAEEVIEKITNVSLKKQFDSVLNREINHYAQL